MSPAEEAILVQLCRTLTLRFVPLLHKSLEDKANTILAHNDELAMYWSSSLKNKHGYALNPTNLRDYFEVLTEIDRAHHIRPEFKIALSPTGYTNDQLTLDWLVGFEERTRPLGSQAEEWRKLAVNNHGSHLTLAFLDYAASHHVEVVRYILSSTHVLQGLDVACFGAFKTQYSHTLAAYEHWTNCTVTKEVFLDLIKEPFERTFTRSTILAASTGLEPVNTSTIDTVQLAPSQDHSAPVAFPVKLPEPVDATLPLLRAIQSHPAGSNTDDLQSAALETAQLLQQSPAAFAVGPPQAVNAASRLPKPVIQHPPPPPPSLPSLLHTAASQQSDPNRDTLKTNCTIALQALSEKESRKESRWDKLLAMKVGWHLSGKEFRAAYGRIGVGEGIIQVSK
ncbi:hypothetical protein VTO73DRAFT_14464 [Trametes versicolor]